MKKIKVLQPGIAAILLLCAVFCQGQRGYQFVDKSMSLDKYQRVVKDTVCNTCVYENDKGYVPTVYYWVEYYYGEPPPEYMELVKSFLTHGFPDTIRGWIVKDTLQMSFGGDCAYLCMDLIQTCTNKINSLLPVYVERMAISIPGCGGSKEEFSIRIWTTDEEVKRRTSAIDWQGWGK